MARNQDDSYNPVSNPRIQFSDSWVPQISSKAKKWFKWIPYVYHYTHKIVRYEISLTMLEHLEALHIDVIHKMREFSIYFEDNYDDYIVSKAAEDVCTECRKAMEISLGLNKERLHCCLKVLTPDQEDRVIGGKVATWARLRPPDEDRPVLEEQYHPVTSNTVWSALTGQYDGIQNWSKPYKCFSCNNLPEYKNLFNCTRKDWEKYYNSTLVFPLIHHKEPNKQYEKKYEFIGFLTFGSIRVKAFSGMPNIFDYKGDHVEDWQNYHQLLYETIPFHYGAIMADTLSMFLRNGYRKNPKGEKDQTSHEG